MNLSNLREFQISLGWHEELMDRAASNQILRTERVGLGGERERETDRETERDRDACSSFSSS